MGLAHTRPNDEECNFLRKHNVFTLSPCYAKLMYSCKKAPRKSKNTVEKDSGGKSGGLHCVYRQKDVHTCTSVISCENECVLPDCSASVKGNLIRAHTDPGGMNLPAELVRQIGAASGFDPSPRKQSIFGVSVPSRKFIWR